jgi:hypothetical protein
LAPIHPCHFEDTPWAGADEVEEGGYVVAIVAGVFHDELQASALVVTQD